MSGDNTDVAPSSSSIYKGSQPPPSSPPQHTLEQSQQQQQQQNQQRSTPVTRLPKTQKASAFLQAIRAIFGFRKTSLTLFAAITYLIVFLAPPLATKNSLRLPDKEPGILSSSWLDLQTISHKPHPYGSVANDEVHDYILKRANALAKQSSLNITISDDMTTGLNLFDISQSWKNSTRDFFPLHYFESSNVLVRIEGSDPSLEGVLLSAHYDSVPTAYGTTDDGTGIASLLGILEHYSNTGEQPLRTIVFNFNNNEEFGLFGAEVFLNHPWSQDVKFFINLEGTGTGERAVLFRTTDYDVGKHYSSVRSPFASSIYQQAFASGVIRSETDYRVYHQNGLRGFDIAFYKPRSLYHTSEDNIKRTTKNALWHMLSNALDLTKSLSNAETIGSDSETPAVYFDFLGLFFLIVPLNYISTVNIAQLVIAPVIVLFFAFIISKRKIWTVGFAFLRLPISWAIAGVAAKFVNDTIYFFNPYIVSRDFITPLVTVGATFLFVNYAVLTISQSFWPVHDLKLVIILELFAVHWAALVYSTRLELTTTSASGLYLVTIFFFLYSIVAIFGLFGISVASSRKKNPVNVNVSSYGTIDQQASNSTHTVIDTDESVPLLSNSIPQFDSDSEHGVSNEVEEAHPEHNTFAYDWSLQYLILVPLTTLLTYLSVHLCLEGVNQTVHESLASHHFVFLIILQSSFALVTPLLPFSYKMNFIFAIVLILTIVSGGLTSISSAPFTSDSPIKFRVAQTIDLSGDGVPYLEVFGREGFSSAILSDLPSVKSGDVPIHCDPQGDGNELCKYAAGRPFLINGTLEHNSFDSYLSVNVVKHKEATLSPYSPLKVELNITALDNRFCYLKFNSTSYSAGHGKSPVRIVTYYQDQVPSNSSFEYSNSNAIPSGASKDTDGNDVFKWLQGIDEIHMHKLNWEQSTYHVGLQWVPKWLEDGEEQQPIDSPSNALGVQVSCYWGEYDAEVVVDGELHRKIPAFDELLQYSPAYTSWSNRFEGLVRIDQYIEL